MNLHLWLNDQRREIDQPARAVDAWLRIQERPTSISLKRGSVVLSAQTVRLEASNALSVTERQGGAGMSAQQMVIVFGVIGHPVVTDTDIEHGDRFVVDGAAYRVIAVNHLHGEVQATAERLS